MSYFGDYSDRQELNLPGYLIGRTFHKIWRIGVVINNRPETKIHEGVDLRTGTEVMIKVQSEYTHVKSLLTEIEIYQQFQENESDARFLRIPFLKDHGHEYHHYFAILQSQGTSISNIFNAFHRQLPIETVLYFGKQLLDLLQRHHSKGYVNGNICTSEVIAGKADMKEDGLIISFLDFGKTQLVGKYINFLPGIFPDPSKKGDIEDAAELLISILPQERKSKYNDFLWKLREVGKNRKESSGRFNRIKLMLTNTEQPIRDVFVRFWNYCISLGNDQTPDYSYLRNLLQDLSWKINGVRISKKSWDKGNGMRNETKKNPIFLSLFCNGSYLFQWLWVLIHRRSKKALE